MNFDRVIEWLSSVGNASPTEAGIVALLAWQSVNIAWIKRQIRALNKHTGIDPEPPDPPSGPHAVLAKER